MKVWLVNHYAIPPDRPGGTRHFALAKHMQALGHEATVVAATHGLPQSAGSAPPAPGPETVSGVRFQWVAAPPYRRNSLARLANMVAFARGFAQWAATVQSEERPHVVIGSTPHLLAAVEAGRAARRLGAKFVAEVRDVWPESLIDLGVPRWHPIVLWMRSLERALLTSADGVVTLLPKSVDYFVGHGLTGDRVCVIPNGIDLGAVPPGTPPRRHSGPFEVVYAGAHGAANGLDTVLDAAAALRDVSVRFVLYGDGPERPRLAERVRNEGLDCVELRGAVPKVQIHEALARADAGLLVLSKMDVFRYGVSPNKLFDYLAMGLPVVVSVDADLGALGQCPAVVQTPAGDALALARAVRTLACEDERSREERGRQGRAFVEAHHDFGVLAVRYLDFLARVLGHDVPQCPQAVS